MARESLAERAAEDVEQQDEDGAGDVEESDAETTGEETVDGGGFAVTEDPADPDVVEPEVLGSTLEGDESNDEE